MTRSIRGRARHHRYEVATPQKKTGTIEMSLSDAEIQKIAWLARIEINDADIAGYAQDLSGILDLIEQMNEADTSSVTPMAHPLAQAQRLRPDVVTEENQRELFQSLAPQVESGLYLVPKVIE
jgi:aspartyl-tRNA(Asn)/glutamyl-tRNA(Gln) amidotransferase subunit C